MTIQYTKDRKFSLFYNRLRIQYECRIRYMLSKSEIRRRRKQSLRDKIRHREKEQELLQQQEQSQRNKNRRGPSASYFSYTNTMSHNKELFSRPSTYHPPTTLKPEQLGHKLASILSKYVTTTPRP